MKCCGHPHRGDVNSCAQPPRWVVVGTQVNNEGVPVLLVLTCCNDHKRAVSRYQAQWEDGIIVPIEDLEFVLDDLGPDAWLAAAV